MATKKKKPIASEFSTIDVQSETACETQSDETLSESDKLQEKAGTVELRISDEIKQKIDTVDKLAEENAKYANTIAELQDRIVDYIKEIAELKNKSADAISNEISELKNENERLKSELNAIKSQQQVLRNSKPSANNVSRMIPNCYRRRIIGEYPSWN